MLSGCVFSSAFGSVLAVVVVVVVVSSAGFGSAAVTFVTADVSTASLTGVYFHGSYLKSAFAFK